MRSFSQAQQANSGDHGASKGQATRRRIVAVAAALFNQHGYDGCSMQQILDATGLEKGGLYRHFRSKQELATAAIGYAIEQAVEARLLDLDRSGTALDRIRALVRHFVEVPSTVPGGCPILNTAIDSDDDRPALRDLVHHAIHDWKARLERVIREGQHSGEIRRDLEPRALANTLIALIEGALMISRVEGSREALYDAQSVVELLLQSVAPRTSRTTPGAPDAAENQNRPSPSHEE